MYMKESTVCEEGDDDIDTLYKIMTLIPQIQIFYW